MLQRAGVFLLALFLCSRCIAQAAQTDADPVVNADRTVSFHLVAPGANNVTLALEGLAGPLPMQHTEAHPELWTVTTPALAPEWYSYHFEADGRTVLDAHNTVVKSSYLAIGNGFLVPGQPAQPWETAAVPHGTVDHHIYTSKVVTGLKANQSDYYVYTPPGYDARSSTRYPVLYLLHGWSDRASGWVEVGHANDIFDNLIASGKAKPMIVVMPLGYGAMSFVESGFSVWNDPAIVDHNVSLFSQALLTEVMPQVEQRYNVSTKKEDRAIAGLSMGGLESLTIGLTHPALFSYVGGFSSAVHTLQPQSLAAFDPKAAQPKLLWIACGTSDGLIDPNRKLVAALQTAGTKLVQIETPGAHTWLVWRDNLVQFAPLLFR